MMPSDELVDPRFWPIVEAAACELGASLWRMFDAVESGDQLEEDDLFLLPLRLRANPAPDSMRYLAERGDEIYGAIAAGEGPALRFVNLGDEIVTLLIVHHIREEIFDTGGPIPDGLNVEAETVALMDLWLVDTDADFLWRPAALHVMPELTVETLSRPFNLPLPGERRDDRSDD